MREGNLGFDFGGSWAVLKYDVDGGFYKTKIDKNVKPTKGVDFLCISQTQPLLMMEAKDFSLGVPHREKFNNVPMAVAIKARDTLAGIIGGSHCASAASDLAFFTSSRRKLDAPPRVVFFFSDLGTHLRREPRRAKQARDVLLKQLKRHLSWLTRDVAVVGLDDYQSFVADLTIRNV
ncbi:MAG: hypothetical protein WC340_09015 [Kiritimatiellia bacterium]